MRYGSRFALKSREGERRARRKFLLLPRQFGEDVEWRWLEWADVTEEVCRRDVGGSGEWGCYEWRWCEVGFAREA